MLQISYETESNYKNKQSFNFRSPKVSKGKLFFKVTGPTLITQRPSDKSIQVLPYEWDLSQEIEDGILIIPFFDNYSGHFELRIRSTKQNKSIQPLLKCYAESFRKQQSLALQLKAGNIMKLGHTELLVVESKIDGKTQICPQQLLKDKMKQYVRVIEEQQQQTSQCRICHQIQFEEMEKQQLNSFSSYYQKQSYRQSPANIDCDRGVLLRPCLCSGSISCIHLGCLQEWMNIQNENRECGPEFIHDNWVAKCEICKSNFPVLFKKQQQLHLLPISKPQDNYLLLWINSPKLQNVTTIQKMKSIATIGRDWRSRICLPADDTISRAHSVIFWSEQEHRFYIQDNNSRYGTAVVTSELRMRWGDRKRILFKHVMISLDYGFTRYSRHTFKRQE